MQPLDVALNENEFDKPSKSANFVCPKNRFNTALQEEDVKRLNNFLSQEQCNITAPHSSHAGGVREC